MLKVGDEIEMFDGSYAFGVKNGKFDGLYYCTTKGPFIVVAVGLKTTVNVEQRMCDNSLAIADILITDNNNGYWFVPSQFARRVPTHTVTFDNGKAITISDESYEALKNQLS